MSESNKVQQATDSNFQSEVLGSDQLTLVDLWAEWCGPCRLLGPTIDALAEDYDGKVKVFKMNVDENPETPSKYNVRGIPTVLLFKNGELLEQMMGNQPKESFSQTIDGHLA